MSWPNGTFPPTEASVFFNSNRRHLQHGQVSNIDTASMQSHDLTFPPTPTAALVLPNMNGSHLHQGQEITPIIGQNTLNKGNEMVNPNVKNSSGNKRKKLKSKVWDDCTKYVGEDGKEWAKCNHCQGKFVGSSTSGTTHLKNHLERCRNKINQGGGVDKSAAIQEKSKADQELNHLDVTRGIIKYWGSSLNPIKVEILHVYQEEKEKLRRYFNKLPCRFSLSIEAYEAYWLMIVYFIDNSWELKKRIINVQYLESDEDFLELAKCLLVEFSIDKNIICMVDDGYNKDRLIEMNKWFCERGSIPFLTSCGPLTDLLHEIDDELRVTDEYSNIYYKGFQLQAYAEKNPSNANKFQIAVDKAKSMGKKVTSQSVPISRGIFKMLEWVIGVKKAFSELEHIDPDFKSINFTEEEWDYATSYYEFKKLVNDVDHSLSDCKYKTANVYFPIVCHIFLKLVQWEKSVHQYHHKMVSTLRKYFDEYWSNYNLILVISIILDPRFKMEIVELWYKEIYGDDANVHLAKIIIDVTDIYNEYAKSTNNSKSSSSWDHGDTNSSTPFKMLDAMGRPCTSPQHANLLQSEFDHYLKDSKCNRVQVFDILVWWRDNSLTYPTLARMAHDFLAIPLYNLENKDDSLLSQIPDVSETEYLDDDVKKPLICTKLWLQY